MSGSVKTMRLRYAGRCAGCATPLDAGTTAHYLRDSKTVRCLGCGPGQQPQPPPAPAPQPPASVPATTTAPPHPPVTSTSGGSPELVQAPMSRPGRCDDCGRQLRRGADAVSDPAGTATICIECVTLDTVHVLGTPGDGARREHARRLDRHQTRVKARHPRLGPVILALADDPQHVTAWARGAIGEEQLGRRLTGMANPGCKVLHDRKLPGSSANIDHLVVTGSAVWVIDAKRYKGRVETRSRGLLSRQPPELFVGGRNQHKLVAGVHKQVAAVQRVLDQVGGPAVPVRGALVFVDAEFGLLASPVTLEDVWVGWGRALRKRLADDASGLVGTEAVAKHLAATLRAS